VPNLQDETGSALLDETGSPFLEESTTSWAPGDDWPGTPGGVARAEWGDYVRVYLRAAIGTGHPFALGPSSDTDRLDAGNVVGEDGFVFGDNLWIDLSASCTQLVIRGGSSSTAGILTKPEASTLEATIWDPDTILDPLNGNSPYSIRGRQRLTPGMAVESFAEIVDASDASITKVFMFTGTADSWAEAWRIEPNDRRAVLTASDATKLFVKMQHPVQPLTGGFDSIQARIHRVVAQYGWPGTIRDPATTGTVHTGLQQTDLSGTAWDQLTKTIADELGFLHFTRTGVLRWLTRDAWTAMTDPRIVLGLPADDPDAHDIVVDVAPFTVDKAVHNSVYAAAHGSTVYHVTVDDSVELYGEQSYTDTELDMMSNLDVIAWAEFLLALSAFPQVALDSVTVRPALSTDTAAAYVGILGAGFVTDIIRVLWSPPGEDYTTTVDSRVVGFGYTISPDAWDCELRMVSANTNTNVAVFTVGPSGYDELDAGNLLAL
jgi:hypothetical protein